MQRHCQHATHKDGDVHDDHPAIGLVHQVQRIRMAEFAAPKIIPAEGNQMADDQAGKWPFQVMVPDDLENQRKIKVAEAMERAFVEKSDDKNAMNKREYAVMDAKERNNESLEHPEDQRPTRR